MISGVSFGQEHKCPVLLLESQRPAEFSSKPNETHLNQGNQGLLDTSWQVCEVVAQLCRPSRTRIGHPWPREAKE